MSCPDCFRGSRLLDQPTGTFTSQYSAEAYLAAAPAPEATGPKRAIILLTDIFGLPLNNPKVIADNFAKALNCDVWVPDIFAGKPPIKPEDMKGEPDRAGVKFKWLDILRMVPMMITKVPAFIASRPSVVDQRIKDFLTKLQADKHYDSLGAIGYCFGGAAVIRLGSTDFVKSIVICHPAKFSQAELHAIKVPSSWACAQDDFTFGPQIRDKTEAYFASLKPPQNLDYEFKVHKGTAHGFAARPNLSLPEVKEGYEKAFEQAVEWFKRTV